MNKRIKILAVVLLASIMVIVATNPFYLINEGGPSTDIPIITLSATVTSTQYSSSQYSVKIVGTVTFTSLDNAGTGYLYDVAMKCDGIYQMALVSGLNDDFQFSFLHIPGQLLYLDLTATGVFTDMDGVTQTITGTLVKQFTLAPLTATTTVPPTTFIMDNSSPLDALTPGFSWIAMISLVPFVLKTKRSGEY